MKILLISGSPRNGNIEYILKQIHNNISHEKELLLLRKKKINYCAGCLKCHENLSCSIKDDMPNIINKMKQADLIIIGISNYFDNVTGTFKAFCDRCHPLYKDKDFKEKKVYFIYTGGGDIKGTKEWMNKSVSGFIKYLRFNKIGDISFKALNNKDLMNQNPDIEEIIFEIEKLYKISN